MTSRKLLYFSSVTVLTVAAVSEPEAIRVPSARMIHLDSDIGFSAPLAGEVVRAVGLDSPVVKRETSVFVVDIADPTDSGIILRQSAVALVSGIPADALWPDANGSIVVKMPNGGTGPNKSKGRNPWKIAESMSIFGNESDFSCGGIIIGGTGEGAAILNGKILRQGDRLGSYSVVGIVPAGVLLGRNNSTFVIPLNRRITISYNNS
jgi:hypothetical protein